MRLNLIKNEIESSDGTSNLLATNDLMQLECKSNVKCSTKQYLMQNIKSFNQRSSESEFNFFGIL